MQAFIDKSASNHTNGNAATMGYGVAKNFTFFKAFFAMITAFSKIVYLLRSTLLLQKIPDYNDQKGLLYPVIFSSLV